MARSLELSIARSPKRIVLHPHIVWWCQLVIGPLWARELSFGIMDSKDTINP
jgi:hypothetical protein